MQFHEGKKGVVRWPVSRRIQVVFLAGFAAAVLAALLPTNPVTVVGESKEPVPAVTSRPPLSDQVLARIHYRDSLQADAAQLQMWNIRYSLRGADSSELIATFGPSVDDNIVESYLTGASRTGYALDDAVMRRLGFKLTQSANAYGAVWERKAGGRARYVARTDSEVAASVASIQRIEVAPVSDSHHFNANVPLFVSKDAMKVAVRMINQGITEPEMLAPYTACSAHRGDGFILLEGSWTVSKVMLTDGASKGCQGWTANEFTSQK